MAASGDDDDSLPEGWTLVAYAPNSPDLALGRHDVESVWRHSTLAYYAVYDQVTEPRLYSRKCPYYRCLSIPCLSLVAY